MKKIQTEDDLRGRERQHYFLLGVILRYAVLVAALGALFCIVGWFIWEFSHNDAYRMLLLTKIADQLGTILVATASILGISFVSSKSS